ncbi:hypothetical protein VDGL01_11108 [Verticillium dahliae]
MYWERGKGPVLTLDCPKTPVRLTLDFRGIRKIERELFTGSTSNTFGGVHGIRGLPWNQGRFQGAYAKRIILGDLSLTLSSLVYVVSRLFANKSSGRSGMCASHLLVTHVPRSITLSNVPISLPSIYSSALGSPSSSRVVSLVRYTPTLKPRRPPSKLSAVFPPRANRRLPGFMYRSLDKMN